MNEINSYLLWAGLWTVLATYFIFKWNEAKYYNTIIKIQQKNLSQNAQGLENQREQLTAYMTRKESSQIEEALSEVAIQKINSNAKRILRQWEHDLMVRELELEADHG